MKENDNFCGYSCGDEKQNLQEIIDRTLEFAKINPQWGQIMFGKFMEMIYDARLKLPQQLVKWPDDPEHFGTHISGYHAYCFVCNPTDENRKIQWGL